MIPPRRGYAAIVAVALLLTATLARAGEQDYLPDNSGWNGSSELVNISRGLQLPVELVDQLDWSKLDDKDVLLLVYPRSPLPTKQFLAFLQRGGQLLIADDFGSSAPLLRALGIERPTGPIRSRFRYRDNPALPIALPSPRSHPLLRNVRGVVTNHPAHLRSSLPTLLGFDQGRQQLLVAGMVGKGRFVALADPSILINGMLKFDGNMTLVSNLLASLAAGGRRRFLLLTGHFGQGGALPQVEPPTEAKLASGFNRYVDRLNDFALTSTGMRVLAFVLAGLVLGLLLLVLPWPRRDLDGRWLRPTQRSLSDETTEAAALLREEVETLLGRLLDAPGPVSAIHPRWLSERVRTRAGDEAANDCRKLLAGLRQVPYAAEGGLNLGKVRRRELTTLYELARRLLSALDGPTLPLIDGRKPTAERQIAGR